MPKLNYPVTFDGGTIGFEVKEPIKHREMIIAVPYNLAITVDVALKDPNIGKIIKENP